MHKQVFQGLKWQATTCYVACLTAKQEKQWISADIKLNAYMKILYNFYKIP